MKKKEEKRREEMTGKRGKNYEDESEKNMRRKDRLA